MPYKSADIESSPVPHDACADSPEQRAELAALVAEKSMRPSVPAPVTPMPEAQQPSGDETLSRALAHAVTHNKNIEAGLYAEKAAEQRLLRTKRAFLPSASATVSYGPKRQFREGVGSRDLEERTASASITQDIWTAGRHRYDRRREEHNYEYARLRRHVDIRTLAADVVDTFMQLYVVQRAEALLQQSDRALKGIVRAEKARFHSGFSTLTDIAQTKARSADISAQLVAIVGEIEINRAAYHHLTGIALAEDAVLRLPEPARVFNAAGGIHERIRECHPELGSALALVESSKADVKRQKAELFPSLQAVASASYRKGADIFSQGEIRDESVIASLRIPIFNKGIEYTAIDESRAELARAEALHEDAALNLRRIAADLFYRTRAAKSTLASRLVGQDAAEEAFDGMKKERKSGMRSSEDVLEAEAALLEANIAVLRAEADYITASNQLELLIDGYGETACSSSGG